MANRIPFYTSQQDPRQQPGAFAPSQFMPSPVATQPEQPAQVQPAPAKANPMDTLNKTLGLNLGDPYQNSAMRQATDAMPAPVQIAGALAGQQDQNKAAQFAKAMQERGGMPQPGSPYFAQQTQVAEAMYNQIYGQQGQPGNGQGAFGQPSTSYAPTGLRSRVLGAGGAEVEGIGGAMVSAAPNAQGGNSFMLRQGQPSSFMPPSVAPAPAAQAPSGPSAAAMKFLQDGIDPNITAPAPMRQPVVAAAPQPVAQPAQPAPSALQSAQQEYQARLKAMTTPQSKPNLGTDQEMGPDGRARFIPGSKGDTESRALADKATLRQRNAADSAKSVIGFIDDAIPRVNRLTAGLGAAAFSKLPGTDARDLAAKIDTIKANIGFETLKKMRQESPTGGALGQVAVKELEFLQAVEGNLDNWQSREELIKNLGLVKKSYERFLMANAGFDPDTAEGRKAFYQASEGQPIGSTGSVPSFTPEKAARLAELKAKLGK